MASLKAESDISSSSSFSKAGLPEQSDVSTSSNKSVLLHADGIHKSFNDLQVLAGIDITISKHQVLSLLGSSGSGKSTLLRCLNLLELPEAGTINFCGNPIPLRPPWHDFAARKAIQQYRSQVAMVFQSFDLWSHLTVLDNITIGPRKVLNHNPETAEQYAYQLLEQVELSDKAKAYPSQLSGGQQQRIAIARALAMRPQLILFDEPTSSLDPERVGEVLKIIRKLANEGMSMIIASHEIDFVSEVSNQIIFMDKGVIIEQGTSEQVIKNPQQERTQNFLTGLARAANIQ